MTMPSSNTPASASGGQRTEHGLLSLSRFSSFACSLSSWWSAVTLSTAILATLVILVLLLWSPFGGTGASNPTVSPSPKPDVPEVIGHRLIRITPGSALDRKLTRARVHTEKTTAPLLTVTGTVVARLAAGADHAEARWDFNVSELATAYADWLKARADVPFFEKMRDKTKELAAARVADKTRVRNRLRTTEKLGVDSRRDLDAAEADLKQTELQGERDVHEAETALRNAIRTRQILERQLFQAGVDPALLYKVTEQVKASHHLERSASVALVVAEVPEARIGLVKRGQRCLARFYAFPDSPVTGQVSGLAPTLSRERRTLRVFFELDDAEDRLKPGMAADIGLGTDTRDVLMVPADAVLHVGQADYVLAVKSQDTFRVTEVKTGEVRGQRIDILTGLETDKEVIGSGAILLKPIVVEVLHRENR